MFIIIAGGGRIGYHILKNQLKKQNEVVVIEKNSGKCGCITEELGNLVICGDACDPAVLESAGISRAEMIIATTNFDQNNLIICQLATKKFHVPHTISIVNDPSNKELFRKLGIESVISSIDAIMNQVEHNIAHQETVVTIAREDYVEIIKSTIPIDSPAVGKTIDQLPLGDKIIIASVLRDDSLLKIDEDLKLMTDDVIYAISPIGEYQRFKKAVLGFSA